MRLRRAGTRTSWYPAGCVAVGTASAASTFTSTLTKVAAGGQWSIVPGANVPGAENSSLNAVVCGSAASCTAVGSYDTNGGPLTLVERFFLTTDDASRAASFAAAEPRPTTPDSVGRMRYGVTMFMTDQTMSPVALARAVEERGLHSLYVPEHTHIPTSRLTPPPTGDAELRDEYKRTLDPFVALAMAAAATERLLVGTGICLVAQRDPIVTAKAIATLDHLSGGRFVLGIGFGWNADEIAAHGVTMPDRRAVDAGARARDARALAERRRVVRR